MYPRGNPYQQAFVPNPNTPPPQNFDAEMRRYLALLQNQPGTPQPVPQPMPQPIPQPVYGFAQFSSQQSQQSQPEVVVETQPSQMPVSNESAPSKKGRKHTKMDKPRAKRSIITWPDNEEYELARCWLSVSEDPLAANYQKERTFWTRIHEDFIKVINKGPDYRTRDSLTGKWTDINNRCSLFSEIFNRCLRSQASGETLVEVQERALSEYNAKHPAFTYLRIWSLLHGSPRWQPTYGHETRTQRPSKKSKTSSSANPESQGSDGRVHLDLNVDDYDILNDDEVHIVEEAPRPAGRRRGRGKKPVEESSAVMELKDEFHEMNINLASLTAATYQRNKIKEESRDKMVQMLEKRQKAKDFEILSRPIDHVSGRQRDILRKMQEDLMNQYDNEANQ